MKRKTIPDLEWEIKLGYPDQIVVGVDEVGRGCLAGPVVAAAVVLPASLAKEFPSWLVHVADSKLLSPSRREELAPLIQAWAHGSAIGVAEVSEIDKINIHHASHLAMVRAIEGIGLKPDQVLVDGKFGPKGLRCPVTAVIKGDQKCISIACASILAKVWRDQYMVEQEKKYPGYGFAEHKGYSTPTHSRALQEKGACRLHRKTFAPVAAVLQKNLELF